MLLCQLLRCGHPKFLVLFHWFTVWSKSFLLGNNLKFKWLNCTIQGFGINVSFRSDSKLLSNALIFSFLKLTCQLKLRNSLAKDRRSFDHPFVESMVTHSSKCLPHPDTRWCLQHSLSYICSSQPSLRNQFRYDLLGHTFELPHFNHWVWEPTNLEHLAVCPVCLIIVK